MPSMFLRTLALVCCSFGTSIAPHGQGTDPSDLRKPCSSSDSAYSVVTLQTVSLGRLPEHGLLNIPLSCRVSALRQIARWVDEDISNWDQLSDQACASASTEQWNNTQKKVQSEREAQLVASMCSCIRPTVEIGREKLSSALASSNSLTIPCAQSSCPPGYDCVSGTCRRRNPAAPLAEGRAVSDRAEALIDELTVTISKVLSPPSLRPDISATKSSLVSNYESDIQSLSGILQALKTNFTQLSTSADAEQTARIKIEILSLKDRLKDRVIHSNIYFKQIIDQKCLPPYACYGTFEYYNELLMKSYRDIMALPVS
jgi:hypothetical protein